MCRGRYQTSGTVTDAGADIEVALHAFPICVAVDVAVAGDVTTTAIETAGSSGVAGAKLAIGLTESGVSPSRVRRVRARIIRALVSRTYFSNNARSCGMMFFATLAKCRSHEATRSSRNPFSAGVSRCAAFTECLSCFAGAWGFCCTVLTQ